MAHLASRRILVIAGSDSSGGAGLEADQKVIAAHGCYAMTATTALTAQNTLGVQDVHHIPPPFVKKQIDACIEDIGVDVIKTGMLATVQTIEVIAKSLRQHHVATTVVDPVMISTSGSQLLPETAVTTLIRELFPMTTILTPNLPEAILVLKTAGLFMQEPSDVDGLIDLAKAIQQLGPKYVLLKGGHIPLTKEGKLPKHDEDERVVHNVLYGEGKATVFKNDYVRSDNTHGTGCSLASAIACNLVCGMTVQAAVMKANLYVEAGIKNSPGLGKGAGPIDHFHSTYSLPFSPNGFVEYLLEREDVKGPWHAYTHHGFLSQLADGSLPVSKFRYYLIQDYLFLIQFARANALASYKAKSMVDISRSAQQVLHLQEEIKLHLAFCQEYNLSPDEIESQEEDQACTAYTRYVLDIGQSEDWLALQVALLPCLIGYGIIAGRLFDDERTKRSDNRYWKWIETYVGEDYRQAMLTGRELIEKHATRQSASRIDELAHIFIHATNMERGFWDMGMAVR